jgi:hypothetical protein
MDTNAEIRRRRLAELCAQEGGVRVVADKAKMNWQSLDQILKKVLLPQKADGTRNPRTLGDDAARDLEEVFDLGRGWFDWPFEHVDFKMWESLDEIQRAAVQGRLDAAIREVLQKKKPKVLDQLKKTAVSDKKVEKHFKPLPSGAAEAAMRKATTSARVRPPKDERERELPLDHNED